MKTKFIVHFVGLTGTSFKVGEYGSRKRIRGAQERYSLEYGAHLGMKILNKQTLEEIQIWQVPQ